MTDLCLLNGSPGTLPGELQRGLAYGDGLFETLRLENGRIPLLELHLQRLAGSAQRLGLDLDLAELHDDLTQRVVPLQNAAVKVSLIRGGTRRGYAPEPDATTHRYLQAFNGLPDWGGDCSALLCTTPLGTSPALGGMKHLNRLEQVLAADEAQRAGCDSGIMCHAGDPLCGVDANLVLELKGELRTPYIRHAGVAGVFRRYMMEQLCPGEGVSLQEQPVTRSMLFEADAIYLTNAVRGPRRVARLAVEGEWLAFGTGELMPGLLERARQQLQIESSGR